MKKEEEEERKMKMKRGERNEIKFWESWLAGRTLDLESRGPGLSFQHAVLPFQVKSV